MALLVNLDAMIRREDFEIGDEDAQADRLGKELKLTELSSAGITFNTLRKPDFQRETSSWTPERIVEFVKSFLDGDLIPALIMWRSPRTGTNFVIDGAHRLSSLIAWVHDDYGDGELSRPFFSNMLESAQMKAAKKTRSLMSEIGNYRDLIKYPSKPEAAPTPEALRRARNMGSFTITLQWVQGDARAAEKSFFRINQSAAEIDPTELELIKARRKPSAIATRALIRAGTGHKYWSNFSSENQHKIEELSSNIYKELFLPIIDYPIKTLDLPVAGNAYTAGTVKMIFDLVNHLNRKGDQDRDEPPEDDSGNKTIEYLSEIKKSASRVFGHSPGSLGLHPGVYCYGSTGKFNSVAFMAAIDFVDELYSEREFFNFTSIRSEFEEFLLKHRYYINQIGSQKGSGTKGLPTLVDLYKTTMEACIKGLTQGNVEDYIKSKPSLSFLKDPTEEDRIYGRNFTRETKSAVFLKEALEVAIKCPICGSRLHFKSIHADHKIRRQDGGLASPENGQLTHPYCNTGYKESMVAKERGR